MILIVSRLTLAGARAGGGRVPLTLGEWEESGAHISVVALGIQWCADSPSTLDWTAVAVDSRRCRILIITCVNDQRRCELLANHLPLEPVMTSSKLSRNCPLLVAWSDVTAEPHRVQMKLVVLGGLGQSTVLGSKVGSRSIYTLKAEQPSA